MKTTTIPLLLAVLFSLTASHAEKEHTVRKPLPSQAEIDKLPPDGGKEFNRLVFETSPYLRQHARNPVDWYPWGREAFAKAAKEDKVVFLSVGYSSCHWCHVMEHESFEDEAIAKLMNEKYICVKVDREERPDIDEIYMNATQAMTQRGGWPNSVWLTPDRRPWFCGTYFPPKDAPGRPGFPSVISQLDEFWTTRRPDVEQQADSLTEAVKRMGYANIISSGLTLGREIIEAGLTEMANEFDATEGGFGAAPKFPPHGGLNVLLYELQNEQRDAQLGMLTLTLDKMAQGGIYDHVGGGFHRYATDAIWFLPHFEKMLYDNGQLGRIYTDAWLLTSNSEYRVVAEGIFDWTLRDMRDPGGGFYSAYDADSEGEEGKYYLWSKAEVEAILGDEAAGFMADYQISAEGNYFEEATRERKPVNIPHLKAWLPDDVKATRRAQLETLRLERDKRVWPGLDDKVLVSWNGLMIGAMAKAGKAFDRPDYTAAAEAAASFIMTKMKKKGRLLHTYSQGKAKIDGYLDDYSFFINALLDLYETTGKDAYLDEAKSLIGVLDLHFRDADGGGYFYTASDAETLLARSKDPFDKAIPSGNGMIALAFVRLGVIIGSEPYLQRGKEIVQLFDAMIPRAPRAAASMLLALSRHIDATAEPTKVAATPAKPDASAKGPNVQFDLTVSPKEVKPGDTIAVIAKFTLAKKWHIQSNKPEQEFVIPTEVKLKDASLATTLATIFPDTVEFALGPDKAQGFSGTGQVILTAKIKPDAKPGKQALVVTVGWQACDDSSCIAPEEFDLEIPLVVGE